MDSVVSVYLLSRHGAINHERIIKVNCLEKRAYIHSLNFKVFHKLHYAASGMSVFNFVSTLFGEIHIR